MEYPTMSSVTAVTPLGETDKHYYASNWYASKWYVFHLLPAT